jgi:hypothetical protein
MNDAAGEIAALHARLAERDAELAARDAELIARDAALTAALTELTGACVLIEQYKAQLARLPGADHLSSCLYRAIRRGHSRRADREL